jgi:type IV pilus assembly protein PilX
MRTLRKAQEGVVLFIALIVLVAMSLAGIALIRGVDTGTIIASNLAFRAGATSIGDLGIEVARGWLQSNSGGGTLYNNQPAVIGGAAYWATLQSNLDLIGNDPLKPKFDWDTALTVTAPAPPSGYEVRYVIHRLCENTGDSTAANCIKSAASATNASSTKGAASYNTYGISVPTQAFYRVTVRVKGPRNAVSLVQATLN